MKVYVKCLGDLSEKGSCHHSESTPVELSDGQNVSNAMDSLGLKKEQAKIVFVNHRISDTESTLENGDNVTLAPATGGM